MLTSENWPQVGIILLPSTATSNNIPVNKKKKPTKGFQHSTAPKLSPQEENRILVS